MQIVRVYSGTDDESHFEDLSPDQFNEIASRVGHGDITCLLYTSDAADE